MTYHWGILFTNIDSLLIITILIILGLIHSNVFIYAILFHLSPAVHTGHVGQDVHLQIVVLVVLVLVSGGRMRNIWNLDRCDHHQELSKVDPAIPVLVSKVKHVHDLLVPHWLRQVGHHLPEVRQAE